MDLLIQSAGGLGASLVRVTMTTAYCSISEPHYLPTSYTLTHIGDGAIFRHTHFHVCSISSQTTTHAHLGP